MDRHTLYLITLTLLITLTVSSLSALNENRLDVYLSMFTLAYFTSTAIFRPKRRTFDFLALILLAIFSYIVTIKVLEVLLQP